MLTTLRPLLRAIPRQPDVENAIAQETGLHPISAAILISRGYDTVEKIHAFLDTSLEDLHDPELLPGYREGADILLDAIRTGKRIYLHGDYDVDGVTSAAIFSRFFDAVKANYFVHVPHRIKEGYGIHESAVARAVEQKAEVFLTCDCGVTAVEPIAQARALGMKVVITDHHEPGEILPDAHSLINPHLSTSRYPFQMLCGAGVVFKLCAGLTKELGHSVENFYRGFLDLVCLGTVSDVMPLVGENRILTKFGLKQLADSKKPGLAALRTVVTQGKVRPLKSQDIGWGFGPRLNAAGRMADSADALRLLLSRDEAESARLAALLEDLNATRKEAQRVGVEHAIKMVEERGEQDRNAIIVYDPDWHPGVIGLIAGKLCEHFYRPTFAFTSTGEYVKGSGRSIPGCNLFQAIQEIAKTHAWGGGGHEMAAGVTTKEEHLAGIALALHEYVGRTMSAEQLTPTVTADVDVQLSELNLALIDELDLLGPFGEANPTPRFLMRNLEVASAKRVGANLQTVQIDFRDESAALIRAVVFKVDPEAALPAGNYDVVANLERNDFNGRSSLQLKDLILLPVS